jgi:hypothetical protein
MGAVCGRANRPARIATERTENTDSYMRILLVNPFNARNCKTFFTTKSHEVLWVRAGKFKHEPHKQHEQKRERSPTPRPLITGYEMRRLHPIIPQRRQP